MIFFDNFKNNDKSTHKTSASWNQLRCFLTLPPKINSSFHKTLRFQKTYVENFVYPPYFILGE